MLCRNLPSGGVVDTSFMFQVAMPASYSPALRPTRGSGFGAPPDERLGATDAVEANWDVEVVHAAADSAAIAATRVVDGDTIRRA